MAGIRGFPSQGVVACFVEPNTSGSKDDFDAPRNAPAKTPASYLSSIVFHSSFFQYEIAAGPTSVGINHLVLAGKTDSFNLTAGALIGSGGGGISFVTHGDVRTTDTGLLYHGLGYVPKFMVALDNRRVPDGYIIQISGNGHRRVSFWADTNNIYVRETAISGAAGDDLPALALTYKVMVFRTPTPNPALPLFRLAGSSLVLARGIIDTARKYLRRTGVGDSPFALNMGVTMDIKNGGSRTASGGVVVSEPRYTGTMAAPTYVSVAVD
jgi:hypothetical protein